jgi:hypothetical protein
MDEVIPFFPFFFLILISLGPIVSHSWCLEYIYYRHIMHALPPFRADTLQRFLMVIDEADDSS